jgi:hypothetical protein
MTRAEPARFLCTEHTMAYPDGRLLAVHGGRLHLLGPEGWTALAKGRPPGAVPLTRQDAEDWCERQGWDLHLLDAIPVQAI